jgi:putative mycofactocin binding protein MftB
VTAVTVPTAVTAPTVARGLDAVDVLDRAWDLDPRVAVRPESFGALLYHFGTRRLSFVKDRRLLEVVQRLAGSTTARDACLAAGLAGAELTTYGRALSTLAATDMLVPRPDQAGAPA